MFEYLPHSPFVWLQRAIGIISGLWMLARYRIFLRDFYKFATTYVVLSGTILLTYLILFGLLGTGLGLHKLFWSEDILTRVASSWAVTVLLGHIGILAYNLDPLPYRSAQKVLRFLGRGEDAIAPPEPTFWPKGLRPSRPHTRRLSWFLHAARLPFLALVFAPALLPDLFPGVPRTVPSRLRNLSLTALSPSGDLAGETTRPGFFDVQWFLGYLLGVILWFLGIWGGILTIRGLIRLSDYKEGRASSTLFRIVSWPFRQAERLVFGLVWLLGAALGWIAGHVYRLHQSVLRRLGRPAPLPPQPYRGGAVPGCPRSMAPEGDRGGSEGADCPTSGCPAGVPEPTLVPFRCREVANRRSAIQNQLVFFVSFYFVCGLDIYGFPYRLISPSVAIALVLAVLSMVVTWVAYFQPRRKLLLALILLGWVALLNNNGLAPYKQRFQGMDYARPIDLRERVGEIYYPDKGQAHPGAPGLLSDDDVRKRWRLNFPDAPAGSTPGPADAGKANRPKLVVVCVSGGGHRSAYWTGVVLDRVAEEMRRGGEEFSRHIRLITGASGGMLGAAYYVEHLYRAQRQKPEEEPEEKPESRGWLDSLGEEDGLDEVAKHSALRDLPLALLPRLPDSIRTFLGRGRESDRGTVLERTWEYLHESGDADRGRQFGHYRELEGQGKLPSLVVSPMIVEDGRLLLISNLDLRSNWDPQHPRLLAFTDGSKISEVIAGDRDHYSLWGLEFFKLFPEAAQFQIRTAVRMNATFPLVSPAVNLPTEPPRRVVDAGYFDNYGVKVAAAWLHMNREWLRDNTSGVLLLQVRDSLSILERFEVDDSDPDFWDVVMSGFGLLTSPIDAASRARFTSRAFANDQMINILSDEFSALTEDPAFLTTIAFENASDFAPAQIKGASWPGEDLVKKDGKEEAEAERLKTDRAIQADRRQTDQVKDDVSLNWRITPAEREAIQRSIPAWTKGWTEEGPASESRRMGHIKELEKLVKEERAERRMYALKQLARARNYDRLLKLREWWRHQKGGG